MRRTHSHHVGATSVSALVFGVEPDTAPAAAPVSAFQATLNFAAAQGDGAHTLAALRRPRDPRYPSHNLQHDNGWLRWAQLPAGFSGPVDMVVHLHGFTSYADEDHPPRMNLGAKAGLSGLVLANPGVPRATIGLVPHGVAGRWVNSRTGQFHGESFNFPHVATAQQLDTVLVEALGAFGAGRGSLSRGRVILTAHSGGGARLLQLLRSTVGSAVAVQGVQLFDATYGGPDWPVALRPWVDAALDADIALIGTSRGETALQRMRSAGHHLRVVFLGGTAPQAKAIDGMLAQALAAKAPDADLRALLRRFYRAQRVVGRGIVHNDVPNTFGGRLLADPGNDLAPQTQDLPVAAARAHAEAADEWYDESCESCESAESADWDGEAFDVIVHELRAPARPADAPTGSAFITSMGERKGLERENRIFEQLRAGNIPGSLRNFHTVRASGNDRAGQRHEFEFYVLPDVLAVGSESDHVRVPTDPVTAQRIADLFGCLLPTARMVEQLYQAAPTKLAFIPGNYAGTPRAHLQDASSSYQWHSRQIDGQLRRPPTILTAGHKKELVISNGYLRAARNKTTGKMGPPRPKLAFYGAYTAAGVPIQAPRNGTQVMRGYPSFAHEPVFVDYSHGVRLVWPTMKVDGIARGVAEVLRDANLAPLIAAEGVINEPRYTLDRSGRPAAAQAQAASSDDPLGLSWGTPEAGCGALGYGQTWDERIRATVEGFLAGWRGVPVRVGTQTLRVHPPYFMNANSSSKPATRERHRLATAHRASAPTALRALIAERRFTHERVGKSTTDKLRDLLQDADSRGLLQADATVGSSPTADNLRDFLKHYGLGIDCSGFVSQAINRLIDLFPAATATDRIAAPHSTRSAALKGGQGAFERVTDPAQLCGGDTMWLSGHIRILAWAERRGSNICFCTAESRASNPRDIGPAVAYWRLVPDTAAGSENFRGWRLERSNDLNAPASAWARVGATHVYGHYRPLRRLLQAAGSTPTALEAVTGWTLQATPQQPYLPNGGRAFVPQEGTFNTAPAGFTVVPASFLPEPTTDTAAAIDTALTVAGLNAAQRRRIAREGLVPLAAAFGASALTELFSRLRWAPVFLEENGKAATTMLVQRLLLHIPGHFRELARRAPSAAEAFVLECLGWAMLSHVRQAIQNATRTRWWIPPAPAFVTAVPNPMPGVSAEVQRLITRLGFIDTVMSPADWNARYAFWRRGLAGRQWDSELNAAQPGRPLYAGLLTVPAHLGTATDRDRAAFARAWTRRLAEVDALHPPMAPTATQVTLDGLRNAAMLRQDAPASRPAGLLGPLNLQGLQLARGRFPLVDGGPVSEQVDLLRRVHPAFAAMFAAARELGWNDLMYQTSGTAAFRGIKHNPRVVNAAGVSLGAPFSAPTQALVDRINNEATPASRAAVIRAATVAARTMSDHALGIAVDLNYPENVDNAGSRPFGSMDPRLVALFEAFNFRWGAGFSPTDPHHFEYCENPCAPAAVAGLPAPAAGPLPGMIPSGTGSGRGGPMLA